MKIISSDKSIKDILCDCEIIIVDKNDKLEDKKDLKLLGFKVESENIAFLPHLHKIYVGVDEKNSNEIRVASAIAIKRLKKTKYKSVKINSLGENSLGALVEGLILGSYEFDKYKSEKSKLTIKKVIISSSSEKNSQIIEEALIVSNATNFTRDIINSTPEEITPQTLAKIAQKEAKKSSNISCKVYDEKYLQKEGMNAFYAVGRASCNPPRLIHLTYKPKNAIKKLVLVGKGLTYDSGGLSLKPSDFMVTMKLDKSGGVTVLAIIKAIAKLNLPIEVHSIIGAAENMVAGNSYKPDDVLVAKNKTTIEVRNTDAEGRLVLADCLCYAQELKPDILIDIATLTGACVVALGEYTFGVMGNSSKLKHSMVLTANQCGELSASLPFNKHLGEHIKSNIADVCNIGKTRYGGAITAGLFLDKFIKEKYKDKWLHLDIAGPSYVEHEWGYNQIGASGVGVRSVVEFVKKMIGN